jgi:hypothetical protein
MALAEEPRTESMKPPKSTKRVEEEMLTNTLNKLLGS